MLFDRLTRAVLRDPDPAPGGGGGGTPPAAPAGFDPTAFQNSLMAEVNKTINGALKNLKADFQKMIPASAQPQADPDPQPTPDPKPGNGGAPVSAEMRELMNELAKVRREQAADRERIKATEEARQTEQKQRIEAQRNSLVSDAMSTFKFADPTYAKDAKRLFASELKQTEDGTWTGPDGIVPAEDYIKAQINARPHILAPLDTSSAGARPGNGSGKRGLSLDDITPANLAKMSPEERAQMGRDIASMLR